MTQSISPDFAKALVKMQGEIEGAKKGKSNPAFRSKYADLGACWDACREALQENGIAVLQFPAAAPNGFVGLRTELVYGPTGETLAETFHMPLKDPTNAQAAGSAITYARRYALCSVIGICPEDDDGNAAAAGPKPVSEPKPSDTKALKKALDDAWAVAKTKDEMKTVYRSVKNSALDEETKGKLLETMATKIKEAT